jgi:hypothetical protein
MGNRPIFYISSSGSSATAWLAKTLSSNEKIICHHAYDLSQHKNSSEFFDTLEKEAKNIGGWAGAIHCSGAHGVFLRKAINSWGGKFAGIIRDPILRTSSKITEKLSWATQERQTVMLTEFRSKIPALVHALEGELGSINANNMEFLNAAYKTIYYDTQLMVESSPTELFHFEKFTTDINNYSLLMKHVTRNSAHINDDFLECAFHTTLMNRHHKNAPLGANEVFDQWDGAAQFIFACCMHYCDKRYNTLSLYKSLGYLGLPQISRELEVTLEKLLNLSTAS